MEVFSAEGVGTGSASKNSDQKGVGHKRQSKVRNISEAKMEETGIIRVDAASRPWEKGKGR